MKESYRKGVASHSGPESCVANRKVAIEALTGGSAGRVLSCEIIETGVPTLFSIGARGIIAGKVEFASCGIHVGEILQQACHLRMRIAQFLTLNLERARPCIFSERKLVLRPVELRHAR
jgi:hypothetical protein